MACGSCKTCVARCSNHPVSCGHAPSQRPSPMISQKLSEPLHNLPMKPEPALADLHRIPDATREQVLLRTDTVPPEIHIAFRWAGERTLFGVRERVKHDDDEARAVGGTTAGALASMIVISLEENLLACGYGIENAIR